MILVDLDADRFSPKILRRSQSRSAPAEWIHDRFPWFATKKDETSHDLDRFLVDVVA
jgi:hypothetical protein